MATERNVLLRVANVNAANVRLHSDRVLYSSIGVFILLYFVYATVGAASFVDASTNYSHPWWQWLVGPPVALAVIAFDRAGVGRVAVNLADLDSQDPADLLRRRGFGMYTGRLLLALLFAVIITEPLMLARYQPEIDARLNEVQNQQVMRAETTGGIAAFGKQLDALKKQDTDEDKAVAALNNLAAAKRAQAADLYQRALADSAGDGVTHRPGCPHGGYCDTLVQQSRALVAEASGLDRQAQQLQESQQPARAARTAQEAALQS